MATVIVVFVVSSLPRIIQGTPQKETLAISFANSPPPAISQFQTHELSIVWMNNNQKKPVEGRFLFTVKSASNLNGQELTLTHNGVSVQPQVSGGALSYFLPKTTFPESGRGVVTVYVTYDTVGTYSWEVGIVKT